jgi:hypothetical protein
MTAVPINTHAVSSVRLRITRRGRAVIAVLASLPLLAALIAFAAFGASTAVAGSDTSSQQFEYVTVQAGQDLWSIAESVAPSADPRDVIAGIVNLNQLQSSAVQAGQRLALPAAYSG